MDDWGRLLSGCRGNTSTVGSNPTLPVPATVFAAEDGRFYCGSMVYLSFSSYLRFDG